MHKLPDTGFTGTIGNRATHLPVGRPVVVSVAVISFFNGVIY